MSTRRSGAGCVSYQGYVYAIGGYNGSDRLCSCERYNPMTDEWSAICSMSDTRSNFGIEIIDGMIYAIGGFNGKKTVDTVECYDPERDIWYVYIFK